MFILIVFDDVETERRLDEAIRGSGQGLSFSSTHVSALLRQPRLDRVPDAVVADVGAAYAPGLEDFREELARNDVPLFILMKPSFLRRAPRGGNVKAEVFTLDQERALAEPSALVRGVVSYVEARTRSDGADPVVPGSG